MSEASLLVRYRGWLLTAILAFTLLRGVAWAFIIAPLNAPDEPSHLLAVAQIRDYHVLPVARLLTSSVVSADSTPRPQWLVDYFAAPPRHFIAFRAMPYESTQPPLYYLLCAVFTLPLPDDPLTLMYACRLISVLLGTLTVFAAARTARLLAPDQPAFYLGVPLALSLWPQFAFQTATVTNDVAINLLGAALAWGWVTALRQPEQRRWPLILGLITALGLLTKLTMVATLPGTAIVLLGRARMVASTERITARRDKSRPYRTASLSWRSGITHWLREAAITAGVTLALISPWVVRNLQTYGEPTGYAHEQALVHSVYLSQIGLPPGTGIVIPPLDHTVWYSLLSFWGVFGWFALFLPIWLYIAAIAMSGGAIAGAIAWAIRRWRDHASLSAYQFWTLAAYAATAVSAIASFVSYLLTTDAALQMRYTFVALMPFTVIGVGGLLYATRSPAANRIIAAVGLLVLLALQVAAWLTVGRQLQGG